MEYFPLLKVTLDTIIFIKIIILQIYLNILRILLMFVNTTHNLINKISILNTSERDKNLFVNKKKGNIKMFKYLTLLIKNSFIYIFLIFYNKIKIKILR